MKWEKVRGSSGGVSLLNSPREIGEDQTNTITIKENSSDNLFWDSRIRGSETSFRVSGALVEIQTWNFPTTCL
jgi:hypothetical protein